MATDNSNGYLKMLIIAISIIVMLVSAVWAITWRSTDSIACNNLAKLQEHDRKIATLEANWENIDRKLTRIENKIDRQAD